MAHVFITGATGYMGRSLITALLARGHQVRGLVRAGSEHKLPTGCEAVVGDALNADSYVQAIAPTDTLIHLVGVPHPNPSKAEQFQTIDLASARIAASNARAAGIKHFIYVSVAQPAPVMQSYIAARAAAEQAIREAELNATILRPWYVLGPGHRWPYLLLPITWLLERLPATRETARRLGFVTLAEMTAALCRAVESPTSGIRIMTVAEIRK
ncbi:MAG: SDR family oxidoreductase [Burkholderiaceae bacterium]